MGVQSFPFQLPIEQTMALVVPRLTMDVMFRSVAATNAVQVIRCWPRGSGASTLGDYPGVEAWRHPRWWGPTGSEAGDQALHGGNLSGLIGHDLLRQCNSVRVLPVRDLDFRHINCAVVVLDHLGQEQLAGLGTAGIV